MEKNGSEFNSHSCAGKTAPDSEPEESEDEEEANSNLANVNDLSEETKVDQESQAR